MGDLFFDFYKPKIEEQKIADTVFAALDFETTGLYPADDRIIETGIVKFDLGGEIDTFGTLINPERHIPPVSSGISGINDEMVAGSPKFSEVYQRIMGFLEGCLIVAHNINFDYLFLKMEAGLLKKDYTISVGIDTVSLARRALKGHQSYSLQNLAKELNLPVNNAHRALDDARLCMDIFLRSLSEIDNCRDMTVEELFIYSNTRIK